MPCKDHGNKIGSEELLTMNKLENLGDSVPSQDAGADEKVGGNRQAYILNHIREGCVAKAGELFVPVFMEILHIIITKAVIWSKP